MPLPAAAVFKNSSFDALSSLLNDSINSCDSRILGGGETHVLVRAADVVVVMVVVVTTAAGITGDACSLPSSSGYIRDSGVSPDGGVGGKLAADAEEAAA